MNIKRREDLLRLAEHSVVGQTRGTGGKGGGIQPVEPLSHPDSKCLDDFNVEEVLVTLMKNVLMTNNQG